MQIQCRLYSGHATNCKKERLLSSRMQAVRAAERLDLRSRPWRRIIATGGETRSHHTCHAMQAGLVTKRGQQVLQTLPARPQGSYRPYELALALPTLLPWPLWSPSPSYWFLINFVSQVSLAWVARACHPWMPWFHVFLRNRLEWCRHVQTQKDLELSKLRSGMCGEGLLAGRALDKPGAGCHLLPCPFGFASSSWPPLQPPAFYLVHYWGDLVRHKDPTVVVEFIGWHDALVKVLNALEAIKVHTQSRNMDQNTPYWLACCANRPHSLQESY